MGLNWKRVHVEDALRKNSSIDMDRMFKKKEERLFKMTPDMERLFEFAEHNTKGSKNYGFILSVKRQYLKRGFISDKQKSWVTRYADLGFAKDL